MKQAIEKAIYYSGVIPTYNLDGASNQVHSFGMNYNSIVYEYSDKESFVNIIKSLKNEIEVISVFAPKDDICYSIFNQLSYENLMLDKVDALYLVNRKDCAIKLIRTGEVEKRVAILKVDSVVSEMPKSSYWTYPLTFIAGGVLAVAGYELARNNNF